MYFTDTVRSFCLDFYGATGLTPFDLSVFHFRSLLALKLQEKKTVLALHLRDIVTQYEQ